MCSWKLYTYVHNIENYLYFIKSSLFSRFAWLTPLSIILQHLMQMFIVRWEQKLRERGERFKLYHRSEDIIISGESVTRQKTIENRIIVRAKLHHDEQRFTQKSQVRGIQNAFECRIRKYWLRFAHRSLRRKLLSCIRLADGNKVETIFTEVVSYCLVASVANGRQSTIEVTVGWFLHEYS